MATKQMRQLTIGQTGKVAMHGDFELHVTRVGNGWMHQVYNTNSSAYVAGTGIFEPQEGLIQYEMELTLVAD